MSNDKEIIFIQATPFHIKDIMKIEYDSFIGGVCEEESVFLDRIKTFPEGFLLAVDAKTNQIVGYICGEIWHKDRPLDEESLCVGHKASKVHDKNGSQFYLASFGTLKSWRGLKIGKALFDEIHVRMQKDFPNVRNFVLIVSEKWETARHIYQKNDYKEIKRIPDFFTPKGFPPETGIVMTKSVSHIGI